LVAASDYCWGSSEYKPNRRITMAEETVVESAPVTSPAPAVEVKPENMKSDEIKSLIENPPKAEAKVEAPIEENKDNWFDKERGFKTAEDMKKSYGEAQNAIREKSTQLKELETFRSQAETQLAELTKKAESAPLSPEDAQRKQAIEAWKGENKESLEFIKNLVKEDLRKESVQETIQTAAITDRQNWKSEFDKDEARKTLWPKMEEIYAKKGDKMFQDMIHNPFPYLEAVAFKENFSSIAQKIKAEAIESYKQEMKQAAEVAKAKSTAVPGGLKNLAGGTDVSQMSSTDLAALLPRGE
jgi:hypothetical protein